MFVCFTSGRLRHLPFYGRLAKQAQQKRARGKRVHKWLLPTYTLGRGIARAPPLTPIGDTVAPCTGRAGREEQVRWWAGSRRYEAIQREGYGRWRKVTEADGRWRKAVEGASRLLTDLRPVRTAPLSPVTVTYTCHLQWLLGEISPTCWEAIPEDRRYEIWEEVSHQRW